MHRLWMKMIWQGSHIVFVSYILRSHGNRIFVTYTKQMYLLMSIEISSLSTVQPQGLFSLYILQYLLVVVRWIHKFVLYQNQYTARSVRIIQFHLVLSVNKSKQTKNGIVWCASKYAKNEKGTNQYSCCWTKQ